MIASFSADGLLDHRPSGLEYALDFRRRKKPMIRSARIGAVAFTLIGLAAAWAPAPAAASECEARIESELIREEQGESGTHYTWQVEVQTDEDCATVEFNLILSIQHSDREDETVVRPGRVRLSHGSIDHQMRYELKPDDKLLKWEVAKSSCERCVLDRPEKTGV